MKYLSVQTFQCGISVSGAATFTGGATINLLALNGATTSSEASLFLGAHGTNEGGQLVLQKGTSNTYAAHLDNYADQFRLLYGTNTGSTGVALAVSLSTRQLILPAYTSTSSFSGTAVGYLAFDSAGNVITVPSPAGAVTSIIAGTGVSVSSATGNVTISIGQSVATSAQVTFDSVITNNNGNGTNLKIGDDAWIGDVNAANTFRVTGAQNGANGYIIFGNSNFDALGRSGTGNLTYAGSTVWTAATLTDLSQLTNGPGYITSAALSGYVPTSRTLTINGTSYDLTANRTWTINTVDYTSRLQHQVKAGVAINKGQAVYVTSADGTNMIVGLASNASEATSSKTMGLLDATVSTNGFANVVTEGLLAGLDTSTAGAAGDPVWLGTGGNLIYGLANKPSAPAHLVFIGIVTRKNANNGEIFVKVQNGFELNEIHDVDLKTTVPVNGHILGFDGTLWVNKTIAGWLGYTPANASGTTNYISKFTGSTTLGNSQIYDDGTNVGIGTASPAYKLDINGTSRIGGNLILTEGAKTISIAAPAATGNGGALTISAGNATTSGQGGNISLQPGNGAGGPGAGTVIISNTSWWNGATVYGTLTVTNSGPNTGTALQVNAGGQNGLSIYWDNLTPFMQYGLVSGRQSRFVNSSSYSFSNNLLVGTTTDSGYKLDVNGTARIKGNVDITTSGGTNVLLAYSSYVQAWQSFYVSQGGGAHNFAVSNASSGGNAYFNNVNVGIGTTSPLAKLEVPNSERILGILRAQSTPLTTFYDNTFAVGTDNGGANGFIYTSGTGGTFPLDYYGELILQSSPRTGYNNGISLVTGTTAPSVKLRIAENGNVGIGTTSPSYKLQVNADGAGLYVLGANTAPYTQTIASFVYGGNGNSINIENQGGKASIQARAGGSAMDLHLNPVGGNVGIGVTSPAAALHTVGTGIVNIVQSSNSVSYTQYYNSSTGTGGTNDGLTVGNNGVDAYVWQRESADLLLGTSNTEALRITSTQKVGIGTASPGFRLDVTGTTSDWATRFTSNANASAYFANGAGYGAYIDAGSNATSATYLMSLVSNGSTRVYVRGDGVVGIGTGSPSLESAGLGLDIFGDSYTQLRVRSGSTSAGIEFKPGSGKRWEIQANTSSKWFVYDRTDQLYRLLIDTDGNVGIGTISPTRPLYVVSTQWDNTSGGGAIFENNNSVGAGITLKPTASAVTNGSNGWAVYAGGPGAAIGDGNLGFWAHGTNEARVAIQRGGNVGIGTTSPSQLLHVAGNIRVTGAFYDSNNQAGSAGQILKSTGTGTDWVSLSEITGVDGSGTANYVTKWSDADTVTNSLIYDNGTNVGIGTTSPGYNFDVNGQVRVQDKLRVGTVNSGNGVVHMSSSATINPNTTTIVWAQNVSVGMCAFIEYYILNNNSLTDQRAGTIMVTWNQSGTPTIAHTETTTPDIGSTTSINFTSSLVGSDARINAVNSSANPYTIVMSYKYF